MLSLETQYIRRKLEGTGVVITRPRIGTIYTARLVGNHKEIDLKLALKRLFSQRISLLSSGTEPNPENPHCKRGVGNVHLQISIESIAQKRRKLIMAFDPKDHLIKIGNKQYLPVAPRIVWFRSEHPKGQIITDLVSLEPIIVYKATVTDNDGNILGTGHGSASAKPGVVWSGREIEKAETAAIGRALAHANYGTLYSLEADDDGEGNHLADSPQSTRHNNPPQQQSEPTERHTAVTSVTIKESKGKRHLQFTTTDGLTATAWTRQAFIDGFWITENEWTQGATTINPPIPVTIATDGKYWNIASVAPMADPFADDVLEEHFPRGKGRAS